MGMYYGIHINLSFKPDTPAEVLMFMRRLESVTSYKDSDVCNKLFDIYKDCKITNIWDKDYSGVDNPNKEIMFYKLELALSMTSSYFSEWENRLFTKQLDGSSLFRSWASTKEIDYHVLGAFFTYLQPYLELSNGTIVLHTLYEESNIEEVVWFDTEKQSFMIGRGARYHSYLDDNHSMGYWMSKKSDEDEEEEEKPRMYNPKGHSKQELQSAPVRTIQETMLACGKSLDELNKAKVFVKRN